MDYQDYLMHFGVPGMKWGVRKQRLTSNVRVARSNKSPSQQKAERKAKAKKAVKVGAVVAGSVLAAYGASKLIKSKSMKIQIQKGEEAYNKIMDRGHYTKTSIATFKDGTSRVMNENSKRKVVREFSKGEGQRVYDQLQKQNKAAYSKAKQAWDLNVQKGLSMNTREAAKNIIDHYKKKKK